MQTDTLSLRMAPKALHSGSFEGYWGTDPGSTESHHYLDELLNERRCYRGPCEFVTGSPYNRLLNEFTQVAASPKAYVLGASVPSLVLTTEQGEQVWPRDDESIVGLRLACSGH